MRAWALLAAAGRGERLGVSGPKALLPIAGTSMLARCVATLAKVGGLEGVAVAAPAGDLDRVVEAAAGPLPVALTPGGPTRQASVREALALVPREIDAVVVHDAARPLAGPQLFERAIAALERAPAAVCAVPLADTLKQVEGERIVGTVAREGLWRAQTPQAFRLDTLLKAHERALQDEFDGTDDATLVERLGLEVAIVPGDERNLKITTPEDLALAEAILAVERTP